MLVGIRPAHKIHIEEVRVNTTKPKENIHAFLKKLDILAIPLIFAFFNLSTPCDVFDLAFFFSPSSICLLSFLFSLVVPLATTSAVASSCSDFRYVSSFVKLKIANESFKYDNDNKGRTRMMLEVHYRRLRVYIVK